MGGRGRDADTFCGNSQAVELQQPMDPQTCEFPNAECPISCQTA